MSDAKPIPWTMKFRGLGTFDILDANGVVIGSIFGALIVGPMLEAVNAHDRLQEKVRNLELAYRGALECTVEYSGKLNRLTAMAEAGAELVAAAQAAVDDPEEFNDLAFTPQRLTKAIAAYEEASNGNA